MHTLPKWERFRQFKFEPIATWDDEGNLVIQEPRPAGGGRLTWAPTPAQAAKLVAASHTQ